VKRIIAVSLSVFMFLFLFQFHINLQHKGVEADIVSAATSKPTPTPAPTPTPTPTPTPAPTPAPTPTDTNTTPAPIVWSAVPSAWASQDIQKASSYGLTVSSLMDEYNKPITRKEFIQLVMNHYTVSGGELWNSVTARPFADTTDQSVIDAYYLGLVDGTGNDLFTPDGQLTRQEAAVILYREWSALWGAGQTESVLQPLKYSDADKISDWAMKAMQFMNQQGILKGTDREKLDPRGITTREQAMLLVLRSYEIRNASIDQTTPDAVSSATVNHSGGSEDEDSEYDEEDDD